MKIIRLEIAPLPKPTMTKRTIGFAYSRAPGSDKGKGRAIRAYFKFKRAVQVLLKAKGVKDLDFSIIDRIVFHVPMPKSYSKKKKEKLDGQLRRLKPDTDNYIKAFQDSLTCEDNFICRIAAEKRHATKGRIDIYLLSPQERQRLESLWNSFILETP